MPTDRRRFLTQISAGAGLFAVTGGIISLPDLNATVEKKYPVRVSQLKKTLAIAMWDFSWILRHHRYGEFGNWDAVLEGLAERGYNAVRIDAMPQFVAVKREGC